MCQALAMFACKIFPRMEQSGVGQIMIRSLHLTLPTFLPEKTGEKLNDVSAATEDAFLPGWETPDSLAPRCGKFSYFHLSLCLLLYCIPQEPGCPKWSHVCVPVCVAGACTPKSILCCCGTLDMMDRPEESLSWKNTPKHFSASRKTVSRSWTIAGCFPVFNSHQGSGNMSDPILDQISLHFCRQLPRVSPDFLLTTLPPCIDHMPLHARFCLLVITEKFSTLLPAHSSYRTNLH